MKSEKFEAAILATAAAVVVAGVMEFGAAALALAVAGVAAAVACAALAVFWGLFDSDLS